MRQWYLFWTTDNAIGQQAVAQIEKSQQPVDQCVIAKQLATQIPWWHNVVIVSKIKNQEEALFYVQKTIENNWSRAVLTHQIEGNLFGREGKALTNFSASLPLPQSDLVRQTLKDPSLKDMNKPIGVSEYQITHALPDELRSSLPTAEEIEAELGGEE